MTKMPRVSHKEQIICRMLRNGGERYGLEMVKASKGDLKRGTIYVTLARLEDKGLVESKIEETSLHPGLPRRLYKITGLGAATVAAMEAAQDAFKGIVHA